MAENSLISKTDVIVNKHRKEKKAGKTEVYTVTMVTPPKHNPEMSITLSSDNDLRKDFPLDVVFAISVHKNPQTKLEPE